MKTLKSDLRTLTELKQHYQLLQLEYEAEKENYIQKSSTGNVFKKIEQGICWWPVSVIRSTYNSLNLPVIEIERVNSEEDEHHFEYNRPVRFFTTDSNSVQHFLPFTCYVSYARDNRMVVIPPNASVVGQFQQSLAIGVQLWFDETSFKTMFTALNKVAQAKNNRLADLREILLGDRPAQFRSLFPVQFPWLNRKQEEAVNHILSAKDTAIVHGPPGTGKTTTLVETVYEILRKENQVLVCAQSNTAVDWIAEKLTDRGINVLRIGNPTRVNDKMLSFTYEYRFEAHTAYSDLLSMRKKLRELLTNLRKESPAERRHLKDKTDQLKNRITETEIQIHQDLFSQARVVASTLVGSANRLLTGKHFSTLIIDEAAQSLEAACWIAISKADRVILAGDHFQLPPTIKCQEALDGGLGITLMQKIARRKPETVSLLEIQYRMHEAIMKFPSQWFYHGRLKAAPETGARNILEYDSPIVWYNLLLSGNQEETAGSQQSRLNRPEAESSMRVLKNYMKTIGKDRIISEQIDFGLISPYKAQVQYIRQLLRKDIFFKPFRKLLRVNTIDGFQGQECDVVLISLVRENDQGRIGFLSDLRRMNVAITRARMKLILLGNIPTLIHHPFYKALYRYIADNGKIIPLSGSEPFEKVADADATEFPF